jgi:hypothetical protein
MAKTLSKATALIGRMVKALMVVLVLPLAIGLLLGILEQLDLASPAGATFRQWIGWGFCTYLGIHILLYRPVTLFRGSRQLFSSIALWLFGGQVASVDSSVGDKEKGKGAKGAKGSKGDAGGQGSTLVAFSPYVVPLYAVLICLIGWALRQWWDRAYIDGAISFLVGLAIAFHWLMTADELQQQRERWHLETYLLAISLVFMMTLVIGALCLPLAVPEFSFLRAWADTLTRTQAIYTAIVHRLFF